MLVEEAKKRFRQIVEYVELRGTSIDEADDNQDNAQTDDNNIPPMDNGVIEQGGMPPMGNGGNEQGGMPPMDNGGMPPMDNGGMPPMDNGGNEVERTGGPEGFDPQLDPNLEGEDVNGTNIEGDDEVIDVSDLTDSMDETEHEVEGLNNKFSEVLGAVKTLEALIQNNDDKINNLKAEFEKRNPTQIEKLSMQTSRSYPFNLTPEQYWEEKEKTSNYSTDSDDNGKKQGQYVITKDDVNGNVNWKSIADTMDDNILYNQSVNNLLKF